MKTVLTLLALVVAVHSQCNVPQYTQNLVHSCDSTTSRIKMPNYQNVTQYYTCSNSNSVVASCPSSTPYFSYVLQECCSCSNYIPAVPCSDLTLPNKPSCASISSTTTSTTARPTTTPRSTTTTSTTTTTIPTPALNTTTTSTTTNSPITPPTDPGTVVTPPGPGTGIGGPPSPTTSNPNLVTPPTPMPTPPNIPDQPPFVNNPPVTG